MKKYFTMLLALGFFAVTSVAMACPSGGNAQCTGANCQCQGEACAQDANKKDKKAKNLKKPEPAPTAAATPSN